MKKALALILAAVLALVCVSALAENSKENEDISQVTTDTDKVSVENGEDTPAGTDLKNKITEAQAGGNAVDALPDEIKAKLPEGFTVINEMNTYKLSGNPEEAPDPVKMTFKFETPYENGEKVMLVVAILRPEPEEIEWLVWEGTGNADGDVEV